MSQYQELIEGSVADCCDSFGASEGDDLVALAVADAQASAAGWDTFISRFLKSFRERLTVVPKAQIDTAKILEAVGQWFDALVVRFNFGWADATIKALMRKGVLAGVELIIATVLGE